MGISRLVLLAAAVALLCTVAQSAEPLTAWEADNVFSYKPSERTWPVQKGRTFSGTLLNGFLLKCPHGFDLQTKAFDATPDLNRTTGVLNPYYIFKLLNFATVMETSVQLRAISLVARVTWNAMAAFHPTAVDEFGNDRRFPEDARTLTNINTAIAYAIMRLTEEVLPAAAPSMRSVMTSVQLDPAFIKTGTKTPAEYGNLVASELIEVARVDGWNAAGGDVMTWHGRPFGDNLAVAYYNPPWILKWPGKWQPVIEDDGVGYYTIQTQITPHVGYTGVPYALSKDFILSKKGRDLWGNPVDANYMKEQAQIVIDAASKLTDMQKLLAEFFDAKVVSFGGLERYLAEKHNFDIFNMVTFDQAANCIYDAVLLSWKEKARLQLVRPISAIPWLYKNESIPSPNKLPGGSKPIPAHQWNGYLRTMPHAEYPSGTSCICVTFTEWARQFFGTDQADITLVFNKGCSLVETDQTPAKNVTAYFKTWTEVEATCSQSRLWAGVHFQDTIDDTRKMCQGIAKTCWTKVQSMKNGLFKPNGGGK